MYLTHVSKLLCIMIGSSCAAQVGGVLRREWVDETHTHARFVEAGQNSSTQAVQYNYDSWNDRITGGISERAAIRTIGSNEIGDDMSLVGSPGVLSAMYTSLANVDPLGRTIIQTLTTYSWYNYDDRRLLGSFTFTQGYGIGGEPGAAYRVFEDDGFWSFLHLQLTQHIYFTQQETNIIGAGPEAIGRILTSPVTLGSSSTFIRDFTDGVNIDLGPNQVNLCYAVRSNSVPAPAIATVGGFGVLILSSRRRRQR